MTKPVLVCVLLVTLASAAGQFTLLTYLAPLFRDTLGASPALIAILLAALGIAGVTGNSWRCASSDAWGSIAPSSSPSSRCLQGFCLFGLTAGITIAAAVSVSLWGLGTFSSNSLQQSRLIAIAPALASASVALNTSTIYLGQAVGAAAGGRMIAMGDYTYLAWVAAFFVALAIILSVTAERLAARA